MRAYSIRRLICEVPSNSLRGFYKGLYDRVYKSQKEEDVSYLKLIHFMSELKTKDKIPNDRLFKDSLKYKNLYKKSACKYILAEIENRTKEKIDFSNLTVEHILPQKKNSVVWKEEVGTEYDRVYDIYLHTLGNLTITGYNSELGTKKFSEKKKILKMSKAKILNEGIISIDSWNEKAILDRAESLSDAILRDLIIKKCLLLRMKRKAKV